MLKIPQADFASTQWTLVRAARDSSTPQGAAALAALCELYWSPLYAFVRRGGHPPEDAEDLTQSFFAHLLEKDGLHRAQRERGKLRSFLLASLKNFLANEWDRKHAQKRGGEVQFLSLDTFVCAEACYAADETAGLVCPERLYERRWALTLLERATSRLAAEYAELGKGAIFEHLKVFLAGDGSAVSYAEAAPAANMSEGAARVAVHRLRNRFRNLLREEVARTLDNPQMPNAIEDELRDLISVL